MEKINATDPLAKSEDLVAQNIEQLKALFPEITAEGKIDFKVLKQILGEEIEEEEEFYRFTWAGKSQARMEAHKPSTGTLRPAKEESVDWDTTQNLYIEGDNLEVLKLLQKSYAGKVKMIYIDPPYNTGKDFVYKDNYKDNLTNYKELTGQIDSDGNKLTTNSESDGRFHSNWLNMMYPRLRLGRNLLKNDGVVFISIDDNENHNLRKICDEVFGESNFVAELIWQKKTGSADAKNVAIITEYVLVYAKNINELNFNQDSSAHDDKRFRYKDDFFETRGPYYTDNLDRGTLGYHETLDYGVLTPDGSFAFPNGRKNKFNDGWRWKWGKDKLDWGIKNGFIELQESPSKECGWSVYYKIYLNVDNEGNPIKRSSPYKNLIQGVLNTHASNEAKEIFNRTGIFSNPKPTELINKLLDFSTNENDIVLDFFSGSASSAHSVMKANAIDGFNRKYIQIQIPEPTDEKSDAFKEGYKTITEIGKERIRRAAKKIAEENPEKAKDIDLGFKVFKLDSSNIRPWDGNPENLEDDLFNSGDNIKADRSAEDVLYEVLLKYGLDLTLPIEERDIEGNKVFSVGYGALFVCLDKEIKGSVAEGIGKWKEELQPELCRVIFRDAGFTDVAKTNATQTLKRFGITEVRSV